MKIISENTLEKISDYMIELSSIIVIITVIVDIPMVVVPGLVSVMIALIISGYISYRRYKKYITLYKKWIHRG